MNDITILLTFDLDAWSGWAGPLRATSPSAFSRGEFAGIGTQRVLELLAQRELPATFFVPGHTMRHMPRVVRDVVDAGHEIGHHGFNHTNPSLLDPDDERRELERGIAELEALAGLRPVGYRAPGWDLSATSVDLLVEFEFLYDSSMMAGDCEPYWCRSGTSWSFDGGVEVGTPVPLVELPVAWHRDDVPFFEYQFTDQLLLPGGAPPSTPEAIWRGDFDFLVDKLRSGILVFTMHPEVIGHGHRMLMLERLLDHMARRGARFSACRDLARSWGEGRSPELPAFLHGAPISCPPAQEESR